MISSLIRSSETLNRKPWMELRIRDGALADTEAIVEIFNNREYFSSMVFSSHAGHMRNVFVNNLRATMSLIHRNRDIRPFIAEHAGEGKVCGYLLLYTDATESITGEKQALIFDYGTAQDCDEREILAPLLEKAEMAAREKHLKYMIREIFIADRKGTEFFQDARFEPEMNRVVKKAAWHDFPPRNPEPFSVRKARQEDLMFIMWLNTQCGSFIIPGNREKARHEIQYRLLNIYSGMSLAETETFSALIIDDNVKEEPAGYLLMKTDTYDDAIDERLGYVYDIAVHPDYWGKRVAQRLMKEGEHHLLRKGIIWCIGDVSQDNPRALKTAIKSAGFTLESIRWMKKLPEC